MEDLPQWDDLLHRRDRAPARAQPVGNVAPIDTARANRYGQAALRSELETLAATPEGQRNDQLNRAGFNLAQLVAAGHLDDADVRAALTYTSRAIGLDDAEISKTLASSLGAGGELPRIVPDLPPVPEVSTLTSPTDGVTAAADSANAGTNTGDNRDGSDANTVRDRFPVIDWRALWEAEDDEEWIIEPLLPARRLVALFSAPKIGKSLLMLELAAAVSCGTYALGYKPDRPRRVLYVDHENDPRGDVRERLQAMGYKPEDLGDLFYLSFPRMAKLDTAFGGLDLMAAVAEYECEVVVIDTISRAIAGEENENDTWLSFYRHTGVALKSAGVACIRLDHSGKDVDKGMRGGSAKYGDVDAVWKLAKVTEETLRLDCTDHRMPIAEKTIVVERKPLPHLHHAVQAEGRSAAYKAQIEQIIRALDDLGAAPATGRRTARQLLDTTGIRARAATLGEAVRQRKLRHQVTDAEGDDDDD